MVEIHTVAGPVPSLELGRTLVHEHVFVRTADMHANWPPRWNYLHIPTGVLPALRERGMPEPQLATKLEEIPRHWLEAGQ